LEAINGEKKTGGRIVIVIWAFAHAVFYFAPHLYLPFDLDELFLLGYMLVLADSSLVVFIGIKLYTLLRNRKVRQ
jgi:hypothetical protein